MRTRFEAGTHRETLENALKKPDIVAFCVDVLKLGGGTVTLAHALTSKNVQATPQDTFNLRRRLGGTLESLTSNLQEGDSLGQTDTTARYCIFRQALDFMRVNEAEAVWRRDPFLQPMIERAVLDIQTGTTHITTLNATLRACNVMIDSRSAHVAIKKGTINSKEAYRPHYIPTEVYAHEAQNAFKTYERMCALQQFNSPVWQDKDMSLIIAAGLKDSRISYKDIVQVVFENGETRISKALLQHLCRRLTSDGMTLDQKRAATASYICKLHNVDDSETDLYKNVFEQFVQGRKRAERSELFTAIRKPPFLHASNHFIEATQRARIYPCGTISFQTQNGVKQCIIRNDIGLLRREGTAKETIEDAQELQSVLHDTCLAIALGHTTTPIYTHFKKMAVQEIIIENYSYIKTRRVIHSRTTTPII